MANIQIENCHKSRDHSQIVQIEYIDAVTANLHSMLLTLQIIKNQVMSQNR